MPPAVVRVAEIVDPEQSRHVREARAGSTDAYELVVRGVIGWAYRVASAIVGSEHAAADATQNALVAAWRELPQLREPEGFEPWFRRILVNECRMQLRRDGLARATPVADDPEALGRLVTSGSAVRAHAIDLLEQAFDRLEPDDRVLVVLHELEGRPLGEIADLLRVPLGTANWRLREARFALVRALESLE